MESNCFFPASVSTSGAAGGPGISIPGCTYPSHLSSYL
jgi:hypothetical protein